MRVIHFREFITLSNQKPIDFLVCSTRQELLQCASQWGHTLGYRPVNPGSRYVFDDQFEPVYWNRRWKSLLLKPSVTTSFPLFSSINWTDSESSRRLTCLFSGLCPDALTVCEHPSWIVFAHRIRRGLFFARIIKNRLWRRFHVQTTVFTSHLVAEDRNERRLVWSQSVLWVYVADTLAGSDKAPAHFQPLPGILLLRK